jgi:hypothetical protein
MIRSTRMPRTVQHWIRTDRLPVQHYGRLHRVRTEALAPCGRAVLL